MVVEWKPSHVQLGLRSGCNRLDQGRGSVRLHAQYDSALLVQAGFVHQKHLRIPTRREFIELVVALKDLLMRSVSRFEGLAWVVPRERKYASELECFRYIVDFMDVMKLKGRAYHDWAVLLRWCE
jgi:hypothetical protein